MDFKARLNDIKTRIPTGVTLVAVSKMQPQEALLAGLDAGLRVFGENRVQEAQTHWEALKPQYPDLKLHLIGPLQTNKVKDAVALFDVIETVDREKLADALADEMQRQGRSLPCFIQVNIGNEAQKSGVALDSLDALYVHCKTVGLTITGLMCIPPAERDPVPYFKRLAAEARRLALAHISMGMSGDYEAAIAQGATHVRIGSALFGTRQTK